MALQHRYRKGRGNAATYPLLFSLWCLLGFLSPTFAQDLYVFEDRTVANGNPINGAFATVTVGENGGGTPFLGVDADITGGSISDVLRTVSDSQVRVLAGAIDRLVVLDTSLVSVSGGTFRSVFLNNSGHATFSNTTITQEISGAGNSVVEVRVNTLAASVVASDSSQIFVTGGTLTNGISAIHNSAIQVTDVSTNSVSASQNSSITITGGTVVDPNSNGFISAFNESTITFGGNAVADSIESLDDATLFVKGGSVRVRAFFSGSSHVTVSNDLTAREVLVRNNATVEIIKGAITGVLQVIDQGSLSVKGGDIDLLVGAGGTIDITGGNTSVLVGTGGTINVHDGAIGELIGAGAAVNIFGGVFGNETLVNGLGGMYSPFTIYGAGLSLTGPQLGTFTLGTDTFDGVYWSLTGLLQNGEVLNTRYFEINGSVIEPTGVTFQIVAVAPEPSVLALLGVGLGMVGMATRRKR